jgi:hypothetical protein
MAPLAHRLTLAFLNYWPYITRKWKFKIHKKKRRRQFWRFSAARSEKKNSKNLYIHIFGFHCVAKTFKRMIKDL